MKRVIAILLVGVGCLAVFSRMDVRSTAKADAKGKKKYSPNDLQGVAKNLFGEDVDRKICKEAVKLLINSGRCTYSMYGGVSYVEAVEAPST